MSSRLYLLDTNTVSYFVKGSYPELSRRIQRKSFADLAVSTVTVAELRYWVANRPKESRVTILIDNFLSRVTAHPWDMAAADTYGELKARLKQMGKPVAGLDLMIASHAIALDAILVSHDQVFQQVPGLKTEDWAGST